jgi:hypothetical protein
VSSKTGRKDVEMTVSASKMVNREDDPRLEAARKRLRQSVDRADTFEAIREIVTNLLGCEEIGLFTVEHANRRLLWSFGIDPQRHGTLDTFEKSAVQRVLQGESHVVQVACEGQGDDVNPALRVFVPICRNGRTVAVLVMLKLLPQKLGFDQADVNLVKLLSDETGKSLFAESASANA